MGGGGWGGVACLCGFGLSVMTVSKTVLYCEFFSLLSREGCVVSFRFWGGGGELEAVWKRWRYWIYKNNLG